jgi:hypothetical protein
MGEPSGLNHLCVFAIAARPRGGVGHTEGFTRVRIGDVPPSQMIDVVIAGNDGKMLEARGIF